MGLNQIPSKGGVPGGNTASRPSSPVIGDTYYDGTVGALLIYDGTKWVPCSAPASQPSIAVADVGDVAYGTVKASVTFTEGTLGGKANGFSAIQNSVTTTSTSNPVVVTFAGNPGSYSFTGTTYNAYGTSPVSESVSQTLTSKPQAPTIGTATAKDARISLEFTAGATGGKAITNYQYSIDGGTTYTAFSPAQTTSPLNITGLTNNQAYTVRIKAVNANGVSGASDASNEATPVPLVITGGTKVTSGGYTYHTFTSSGDFFLQGETITSADILVVAGGAGGAGFNGGGGGAGGLLQFTGQTITPGTYTVTVGSGGNGGGQNWYSLGGSGGNSRFGSLTECIGGGGGRGYNAQDGYSAASGGSGGGGGFINGSGASGTAGQGYSGGNSTGHTGNYNGGSGGGGGAGGPGGNSTYATNIGGVGGIGKTSALINAMGAATGTGQLSGGNYYFAGGGAGNNAESLGGLGGGAQSGGGTNPRSGTANTGGGGGGNDSNPGAGAGGSGIVIVRYAEIV
jgi:hypothetical protein